MAYASRREMIDAYGAAEISGLESQGRDIEAAIRVAEADADSYLGGRYRLPVEPPSPKLTRVVCDLARYELHGVNAEGEPKDRADLGRAWLRDVAARKAHIEGAAAAQDGAGQALPGQSPARHGQAVSGFDWSRY